MDKHFLIAVLILLTSATAMAGTDIVVPLYTKHIVYQNGVTYNENNPGIGVAHSGSNYSLGASYILDNSFNKESLYLYATYDVPFKSVVFGVGVAAATGYDKTVIGLPLLKLRYKWLQLSTTYPTALMSDERADLVHLDLLIPLDF